MTIFYSVSFDRKYTSFETKKALFSMTVIIGKAIIN